MEKAVVEVGGAAGAEAFGPRFDRTLRVRTWVLDGRDLLTDPGLVDEFGLRGDGVLGYEEAEPGEAFLKIGVGALERMDARDYRFSRRFRVLEAGRFRGSMTAEGVVEALWISPAVRGYRVRLRKRLWMEGDTLHLETRLRNTGMRAFTFRQYNHHFLNPTGTVLGPQVEVDTDFPLVPEKAHDLLVVEEKRIRFTEALPGSRSGYFQSLQAFPAERNRITVRVDGRDWMELRGDFPSEQFEFFALGPALCPEVFYRAGLQPGEERVWRRSWRPLRTEKENIPE